jgi:hypothetical protein
MPKKRRKTVMKGLRFTVPLMRLVVPLDSREGKLRTGSAEKASRLHPQTLLRLVRIETRLEDLVRGKASHSGSAPAPDPIQPVPAPKKKANRMPPNASRAHESSSKPKKKVALSKRQFPFMILRLFGPGLNKP